MRRSIVFALPLLLLACSKGGTASSGDAGTTGTTGAVAAADPCAPFVAKLVTYDKKSPPETAKKIAGAACEASSPGVRACVVSAATEDDAKKCMEPEKQKISSAVFAMAMAESKAREDEEAKKPPAPVKVDALGVVLDVGGKPEISPSLEPGSQRVQAASIGGGVVLASAGKYSPKTLDAAKSGVKSLYKPSSLEGGALPDGFWVSYAYDDLTGKKGNGVKVHRTIGKKAYDCESAVPLTPEQAAAALTACKSLRAM